jgi:exodeoxyribonuclease VIII
MTDYTLPNGAVFTQNPQFEPFLGGIPDADYFRLPYISNSFLGLVNAGIDCLLAPVKDDTGSPAMSFGSLVHCLLLEPELFDDRYKVYDNLSAPKPDSVAYKALQSIQALMGKEDAIKLLSEESITEESAEKWGQVAAMIETRYKANTIKAKAQEYVDYAINVLYNDAPQTAITLETYELACKLVETAKNTPMWKTLVENTAKCEQTVCTTLPDSNGFVCKGKIDLHTPNALVDVKTTSKSINQFKADYLRRQYYRQLAFYLDLYNEVAFAQNQPLISNSSTYILVIQTIEPYLVWWVELSSNDIEEGAKRYKKLLGEITSRMITNNWEIPAQVFDNFSNENDLFRLLEF